MKPVRALVSLGLVGALGGCAGWTVGSEAGAGGAKLAHSRTYRWTTEPAASDDRLLDQAIRDRVAAELLRRGIRPAAAGEQPDFLVDYRVQSGARIQTVVNGDIGVGAPSASGATVIPPLPAAITYTYSEEALVLDFLDARSGRVLWRGYASYVVDKPPEIASPRTQQAVSKILRRFPGPEVARAARPAG